MVFQLDSSWIYTISSADFAHSARVDLNVHDIELQSSWLCRIFSSSRAESVLRLGWKPLHSFKIQVQRIEIAYVSAIFRVNFWISSSASRCVEIAKQFTLCNTFVAYEKISFDYDWFQIPLLDAILRDSYRYRDIWSSTIRNSKKMECNWQVIQPECNQIRIFDFVCANSLLKLQIQWWNRIHWLPECWIRGLPKYCPLQKLLPQFQSPMLLESSNA
jgi:hypothetical protein